VVAAAHRALGASLIRSLLIGLTDWTGRESGVRPALPAMPGPQPEFFFVPTYAPQRLKLQPELNAARQGDMRAVFAASRTFLTARRLSGADEILAAWRRLVAGDVAPNEGLVLSF
jgi:hypothetical protein